VGEIACGGEIAPRAVKSASTAGGWISHLMAKPEDFTFCRKAKDFTFFDVWLAFVLLAPSCDKNRLKQG